VIVEELVDNACNYSRRGTPVQVHLSVEGRLTVTDTGRGMAPEDIKRIAAFRRSDMGRNDTPGMGLGLALVQKLAAKCGAQFSLTSPQMQGTKVEIVFQQKQG
jgi:signal transduction histidine kinase